MIRVVVFDLDDTLYPEIDYVKSGFGAIGRALCDNELPIRLWKLFCEDRQNVYQRAGLNDEECKRAIEIYRSHMPDISLNSETLEILKKLRDMDMLLGIITDGRPQGQRNKIKALGLENYIDRIIITDELGGEKFRKPNSRAFELMRDMCNCEFNEMMYIGDNPQKDFLIGSLYPIVTVRTKEFSCGLYDDNKYMKNVKEKISINAISDLLSVIVKENVL